MTYIFEPPPRPKVDPDNYFGGCPVCGKSDGYLNVGGNHWFVCDADLTTWCVGYNLFSCWKDETEETWRENAEKLSGYTEVEPIRPVYEAESLPKPAIRFDDARPGTCPSCGKADHLRFIKGRPWFVCEADPKRRCVGYACEGKLYSLDVGDEDFRRDEETQGTPDFLDTKPLRPDDIDEEGSR